jgi:hypothetical protein
MKGGVTKKEFLKLKKKLIKQAQNGEDWMGIEIAKVVAYENNKPYQEILQMMERDMANGTLKPSGFRTKMD